MTLLPGVTTNIKGGIVRPALNRDGIAGFALYNDNIADLSEFSATNRVIKFTNLPAIEATGITAGSTNFKFDHYQMKEFFRGGGGEVWIGVFDVPATTYDYTELNELYSKSNGDIKIYAVLAQSLALNATEIGKIQTIVGGYEAEKKPAIAIYGADTGALTFDNLINMRGLVADAPNVSLVTGCDTQNEPANSLSGISVPAVGLITGALAGASVEQNILEVGRYNYTDGTNMVVPGFFINDGTTDDQLVSILDKNKADLDALNAKGNIFFRYSPNQPGSYLSNDHNGAPVTDTFNSIHIMRVRNKVVRETDRAVTPLVGSNLTFNADGSLTSNTITRFESAVSRVLDDMITRGEISAYEVYIDPTQESQVSKNVTIQVSIVPVESADYITIDISFVKEL